MADFKKTSTQQREEILGEVQAIQRHLSESQTHVTSKSRTISLVLMVLVLTLVQFILHYAFEARSTKSAAGAQGPTTAQVQGLTARDQEQLKRYLERIAAATDQIEATKNRVAPAMQIDGPIHSIRTSLEDVRQAHLVQTVSPK